MSPDHALAPSLHDHYDTARIRSFETLNAPIPQQRMLIYPMVPPKHTTPTDWPVRWGVMAVILGYVAVLIWIPHWLSVAHATESHPPSPPLWATLPFITLLLLISVAPLSTRLANWWSSPRNQGICSGILAGFVVLYYLFLDGHAGGDRVQGMLGHALLDEYLPFIVLLFSLFVISGGMRVDGDLLATPGINTLILAIGGGLASIIGTTGAAMLLIRVLLRGNSERRNVTHTVVFFIFIVANCGGCLLPTGDPPLFLGYLKGVSFFWPTRYLWGPWMVVNIALLAIYFGLDYFVWYPRESRRQIQADLFTRVPLRFEGIWLNGICLLGVVLAVAALNPSRAVWGTNWRPQPYLREIVQLFLVWVSLTFGPRSARTANQFSYHPIQEVAALFFGIFITMQPALEILRAESPRLGVRTPVRMFWGTGLLSAFLDNAPTYAAFYEVAAARSEFSQQEFASLVSQPGSLGDSARQFLVAISLGAVFFGAMTYIGNGPNFMVRAIAEQAGVRMPSFFGYILRYAIPILLPIWGCVAWWIAAAP